MTREELFDWLKTCPTKGYCWVGEDEGNIRILFEIDEDEENEDAS